MRVVSWNVNGIRSIAAKGFGRVRVRLGADVICLQETRASVEQLPRAVAAPRGWHAHWVAAERKGYSGVGLLSRPAPDEVAAGLGDARFDIEGRVLSARFGALRIVNVYFPNGNGRERDNSRVPYKLDFYRALFDALEPERARGAPILVAGDFNTAPREIDLARPAQNRKTSGFLDVEREEIDRWLRSGWTDTFRHFHPNLAGAYSWWSQRFGVREKNIGWRLDLVLASPGAMARVRSAFILADVRGSDHCPVGVDLDATFFPVMGRL